MRYEQICHDDDSQSTDFVSWHFQKTVAYLPNREAFFKGIYSNVYINN